MFPADSTIDASSLASSETFRVAIADARDRVGAVLVPACPTVAFLVALRDEVDRAVATPEAVPYPELADPDAYWDATVVPQARDTRAAVAAIVEWLEERIVVGMVTVEAELKTLVDDAVADPSADPPTRRRLLADRIDAECAALHARMGEVRSVLPDDTPGYEARQAAAAAMRAQAAADVDGLRAAYLRDAGGDDAHQRFAEQQWEETFADRVTHRETMLAGEAPWRHQEFALIGYERARAECERIVDDAAARLQAPFDGIRMLLLERFDEAVRSVA